MKDEGVLNVFYIPRRKCFLMFHRTSWTLIEKVIIFSAVTLVEVRGFFSLKLSPSSGHCPWWLIFFKHLSYQSICKETVNIGEGQVRGTLFNFSVVKKCPFCIFQMLSSVSEITPGGSFLKDENLTLPHVLYQKFGCGFLKHQKQMKKLLTS